MELIDNVNHTLKEDLQKNIHGGSKLSVAAACFSGNPVPHSLYSDL